MIELGTAKPTFAVGSSLWVDLDPERVLGDALSDNLGFCLCDLRHRHYPAVPVSFRVVGLVVLRPDYLVSTAGKE